MFLNADTSERPPRVFNNKSEEIVLIVDDDPQIRSMMKRILFHEFDTVLTAGTPDEAEEILEENDVTQIISDYDLGPECPPGTELVIGWRQRYPSIRRVLLLTGTHLPDADIPPEVDQYFAKGEDPRVLIRALKS